MTQNAFGLVSETEPDPDDPYADPPVAEPEAPAPEAAPEAEPEVVPEPSNDPLDERAAEPEATPEVEPEAEPAEDSAEPYEGRYAGKYSTVQELEEAHRNALSMAQREHEALKAAQAQTMEAQEMVRQAAAYFSELQQKEAEATLKQRGEAAGWDEDQLAAARDFATQQVNAQLSPVQAQLAAQQQQQAELVNQQQVISNIQSFRSAHADLTPDVEQSIVDTFSEFGLDPTRDDALPLAHEIATNEKLHAELTNNPGLMDSWAGIELARLKASMHTVAATPSREETLQRQRKAATVESGPSGMTNDAGADEEPDEWEQVLNVARADRFGRSPLLR